MKRLFIALLMTSSVGAIAEAQPPRQRGGQRRPGQAREFPQRRSGFTDPIASSLDLDGDGSISAGELAEAPKSLANLDSDDNGTITAIEIRNAARAASSAGRSRSNGVGSGRDSSRPGSIGSSSLERAGLSVGDMIPDLTIHDDQGNLFQFADKRGKYAVIVFGCLT